MQHGVTGQQFDEYNRCNPYEYDHKFKFVLLGDSGVGKSSLIRRFCEDEFSDDYLPRTIGVDFRFRTVELDGKIIQLQIWDTNGQERFRAMNPGYYRGVHGILVFFDITDEESFNNTKEWLIEIERYAPENVSIVLVGTKSDLISEQVVTPQRAQALANKLNIPFIMTSAKINVGVDEAFTTLTHKVFNEQFKSKVQPVPVPTTHSSQPETIGIRRQIGNFFLWLFNKIWDGLKFIGRGLSSIFHRLQNSGAEQPLAAGPPELKKTSAEIAEDYQRAQRQLVTSSNQNNPLASISHRSTMITTPVRTTTSIQELERQRNEAKLRAEIAALKRQKAADEEKTAVSRQRKILAELDTVSATALLERKLKEKQRGRI